MARRVYTPRSRPTDGANIRIGHCEVENHMDLPIGAGGLLRCSVDACGAIAGRRGSFVSFSESARAALYGRDRIVGVEGNDGSGGGGGGGLVVSFSQGDPGTDGMPSVRMSWTPSGPEVPVDLYIGYEASFASATLYDTFMSSLGEYVIYGVAPTSELFVWTDEEYQGSEVTMTGTLTYDSVNYDISLSGTNSTFHGPVSPINIYSEPLGEIYLDNAWQLFMSPNITSYVDATGTTVYFWEGINDDIPKYADYTTSVVYFADVEGSPVAFSSSLPIEQLVSITGTVDHPNQQAFLSSTSGIVFVGPATTPIHKITIERGPAWSSHSEVPIPAITGITIVSLDESRDTITITGFNLNTYPLVGIASFCIETTYYAVLPAATVTVNVIDLGDEIQEMTINIDDVWRKSARGLPNTFTLVYDTNPIIPVIIGDRPDWRTEGFRVSVQSDV